MKKHILIQGELLCTMNVFNVSRCADKILNQLEIHADAVIANGTAPNSAATTNRNNLKQIATSLKNHQLTPDPVIS